jgi:5-formyltetrahydrofolate cyclo-ligase
MISKSELREIFKQKRNKLTTEEVEKKSVLISNNFIKNLFPKIYQNFFNQVFATYIASNNEVKTNTIIDFLIKNNFRFSYPKIIKKNLPLQFILAEKNQKFTTNELYPNLSEPFFGKVVTPDIILVPLVVFDRNLSRVGMGGGFFDRTLEQIKKNNRNIISIGLAYKMQKTDQLILNEKHDQKLDFIVTESDIFSQS